MKKQIENLKNELNSRKGEWAKLADYSGLSYSWLSKFNIGLIKNPTVDSLDRLKSALDNI